MASSIFSIAYRCASTITEYLVPSTISTDLLLLAAYDATIAACNPETAVADAITLDTDGITVGGERYDGVTPDDVVVVAIGKAATAMVRGVVSVLGPVRGLAVSNHIEECPVPLLLGAHPVPDETSLVCGESLLSLVGSVAPSDVVIYLISGGGSSIVAAPIEGVSIDDLADLNRVLMNAGIAIGEMNEIRASVSRLKGGGLAAACAAGRSVTLVLSDVVGEGPSHVASGPTLGAGMGADGAAVVARYQLQDALPASVLRAINAPSPVTGRHQPFSVIGSTELAANSAARYLSSVGVASRIATTQLEGEARIEAQRLIRGADRGIVTIAAGETTVNVAGDGVGGRNQEAALAAAIALAGSDAFFLACGTDGIDGPTPAAGAVVDGDTAARAKSLGIDLQRALSNNDSHTALDALGAIVVRGDTGTNVADLWLVARGLDVESDM